MSKPRGTLLTTPQKTLADAMKPATATNEEEVRSVIDRVSESASRRCTRERELWRAADQGAVGVCGVRAAVDEDGHVGLEWRTPFLHSRLVVGVEKPLGGEDARVFPAVRQGAARDSEVGRASPTI